MSQETIFVGLGSNLGDCRENLRAAVTALAGTPGVRVLDWSSLYRTAPMGPVAQGDFLNAVLAAQASLEPEEFLDRLLALEASLGRVRRPESPRWGPRLIDLDVLLWGQRVINSFRLTVPHPEMAGRAFVLAPLAEIAPGAWHPGLKKTAQELLAALGEAAGVEIFESKESWWPCRSF